MRPTAKQNRTGCPRILGRLRACRLGAAAIEFALVMPIFFVMVLGIMEVARAMWIKSTLQWAVEQTTRYALANPTANVDDLETYAVNRATHLNGAGPDNFTVVTPSPLNGVHFVEITASYAFTTLMPITALPDMTLTAKSKFPRND